MRSIGAWRWMYRPLRRRSGLELILGELAGEETARLVAELRDTLVDERLVEFIVSVHGRRTIGVRPARR